jgi:hypothetical protein
VRQSEQPRIQRIKEYVLERLREELACAPRGAQAHLAKELGVSSAHFSNMLSERPTRQPGEDLRRKAAARWGMTYGELEAVALGDAPTSTHKPVAWRDAETPPNLAAVLTEYAWMAEVPNDLRGVVREQARQHLRFGGHDYTHEEWQRIVTGLEREALALLARRGERATATSMVVPRHAEARAARPPRG